MPANTNTYDPGDRVDLSTSTVFQDSDGTAFDPDVVTFIVNEPGVTSVEYVYGTDPEVVKNDTGDYTCTIDVETIGWWYYRIQGETSGGQNRGAAEGSFNVRESRV